MTRCKLRIKPAWHETRCIEHGRPLLVAETPSNLLLRLKGTRQILELPWQIAWLRAAQARARCIAIEKINRRARRSA